MGKNDHKIWKLVCQYRLAIERAHIKGQFSSDIVFKSFPHGCCSDTCFLMAEYLKQYGIDTIWYSAKRKDWSHAWLVLKDKRVKQPMPKPIVWFKEESTFLNAYGVERSENSNDVTGYEEDDLSEGLIIDITADQFEDYDEPVYVGAADSFHRSFEFIQAHEYESLRDERLQNLYRIIEKNL